MNPIDYYTLAFKKYADFEGRATRAEFWYFVLINFLVSAGISIIGLIVSETAGDLMSMAYGLVVLVPGLSLSVRRLHDTNRSGWWLLIALIPFIGFIVLLIFYITEGTPGPNHYGEESLEAEHYSDEY